MHNLVHSPDKQRFSREPSEMMIARFTPRKVLRMRNYETLYIRKEFAVLIWHQVFSRKISFGIWISNVPEFYARKCVKKWHNTYQTLKNQIDRIALEKYLPFLGVIRFDFTPINVNASAFASSVWGRCRFISSPSKSAL